MSGALKAEGYDAVLVATGTPQATGLEVQGEPLRGVVSGLEFLREVRFGRPADLAGKRVVVVGGGNVAMDAARTAQRLGALETVVAYRRGREQMPAHAAEAGDAEEEGVRFKFLVAPVEVLGGPGGEVTGLRCTLMKLGPPDASGRRRAEPVPGSNRTIPCDVVISAIGLVPDPAPFAALVPVAANRAIHVDPVTLQSAVPYLFAAGDVVSGASDITRAIGQGRRAAHMIDRWLQGGELDGFDALYDPVKTMDKAKVLARQQSYASKGPGQAGSVRSWPAPRLRRGRTVDDRGGSARRGRPLPGLRCLLGVQGVRRRLPRRRHPSQYARRDGGAGCGRRRGRHGLQALRRRCQARIRLGQVPQRHYRDADGPLAGPDTPVQYRAAPQRREDP